MNPDESVKKGFVTQDTKDKLLMYEKFKGFKPKSMQALKYVEQCQNDNNGICTIKQYLSIILKENFIDLSKSKYTKYPDFKKMLPKVTADNFFTISYLDNGIKYYFYMLYGGHFSSEARLKEIVKFLIHQDGSEVNPNFFFHSDTKAFKIKDGSLAELKSYNPWWRKDVEKYDQDALHQAVLSKNLNKVKKILENTSDINLADKLGRTPLHYAAFNGDIESAKLLLTKGANINAVDKSKQWTPLFFAVYMKHEDMAIFLIKEGADQTLKDKFNRTVDDYRNQK